MKAIGGYPELELRKGEHYHKDAIRLNTARNCLEYILLARQYRKVYVPYYTCEAVLEPFTKITHWNIKTEFYHINEILEPFELPDLKDGDAFLYTNYFGLKQDTVDKLAKLYGDRLIVDNSQAFFNKPHTGIDTFYSARKFFGVPDGAYLYTGAVLNSYNGSEIEKDCSFTRMYALLKRIDLDAEAGYKDFQETEKGLSLQPIRKMSPLTEAILGSIDYSAVRKCRRENYMTMFQTLHQKNSLCLELNESAVPLCYPFLPESAFLKQSLIEKRVFVPTYWPNIFEYNSPASFEFQLAERLLPLPIDQRYDSKDMKRMISILLEEH